MDIGGDVRRRTEELKERWMLAISVPDARSATRSRSAGVLNTADATSASDLHRGEGKPNESYANPRARSGRRDRSEASRAGDHARKHRRVCRLLDRLGTRGHPRLHHRFPAVQVHQQVPVALE